MAAGKQAAKDITIRIDDGPGGSLAAITQFVRNDLRVKILNVLQESHAYGDSWNESTPSGHGSLEDIPLSGFYDDTAATGPHVLLAPQAGDRDPQGATRTLEVGWGNSKTTTVEGRMLSYQRLGKVGALTEYEAVFRPHGQPTEA